MKNRNEICTLHRNSLRLNCRLYDICIGCYLFALYDTTKGYCMRRELHKSTPSDYIRFILQLERMIINRNGDVTFINSTIASKKLIQDRSDIETKVYGVGI